MARDDLQDAIRRGLAPGGDLKEELYNDEGWDWQPGDVDAVCEALATLPRDGDDSVVSTPLHAVTALFQDALDDRDAARALQERGIPHLVRIFRSLHGTDDFRATNDAMFVLKQLAIYQTEEGTDAVLDALRSGWNADGYMWQMVLGAYRPEHPHTQRVMETCREHLPTEFAAVALLDAANSLCIDGTEIEHPFDTEAGRDRLRDWLKSSDPDEFSYAHSATAALPFIDESARHELLALAMDHIEPGVQLEAAWAAARLGSEAGIEILSRACRDRNKARRAIEYLEELDREDAIPDLDDDFFAMAICCDWLAHPNEMGRFPDEIRLYDTRELHWPPTDDLRWLWLFEYRYEPVEDEEEEAETGIVMTGSVTWAMFGETTADLPPEDVYGIHCCWELQCNDDPRAPEERGAAEGRAIIAASNPGFDS